MNNFADWIDTLRTRGITATIDGSRVDLNGPFVGLDGSWLSRYHDTFLHAAAHPAWWAAIVNRQTHLLHPNDTPDRCVARGCPGELEHYTPDAVPFCADHNPDWWTAHLPGQEAA